MTRQPSEFTLWMNRTRRLLRIQRGSPVLRAANGATYFWRCCWDEGLSPRAAVARLREKCQ